MGAKAAVYTKFDQTGQSYADATDDNLRYARTPLYEFLGTGVYGGVSSISVAPGAGAPALILFRDNIYVPLVGFDGEFMQFTNASDVTFHLDLAGDLQAFNNAATSMLVVQTQLADEFRISFQTTVVPEWNDFLEETLPSNIQKVANPTVRWVAFPQDQPYLSSNRVYVRIKQKIIVELENWFDYDASFTYWIRFRAEDGKARASVSQWSYWVEGGIFTGSIADELEPKVDSGADDVTEKLNSALDALSGVTSVYLLPGNQTAEVAEGFHNVHWSNSRSDATVVIQT